LGSVFRREFSEPVIGRKSAFFSGEFMPEAVQAGTILMKEWPQMTEGLGLQTEPCSGHWKQLLALDGIALERKIHAANWSLFFMAAEVNAMFPGAAAPTQIKRALQRILGKVRSECFNGLEVTGIVAKRFLGMPYTVVSAHSRHLQRGNSLEGLSARQKFQRDADWAEG
jgi:hypothetical protein